MRQEDKEVDGPDIEHADERKRDTELVQNDPKALHDLDGQPELSRDSGRSGEVIAAMNQILERRQLVINDLKLPQREQRALEALKAAVEGRDTNINQFLYAEDRRTMLEQALAVLQPDIVSLESLGKPFDDLLNRVATVRQTLNKLDAAQGRPELRWKRKAKPKGEEGDTDDKPDDDDDDASLDGPERKIEKPKTSLTGPERKEEAKPGSTLSGPEPKPAAKIDKPASSLDGPEVKQAAKPETSLGDPKEIAQAAKKPWWKRALGG